MANPARDQDRATDMLELFQRSGCTMFAQQRAIYAHLAREVKGSTVLEAGCGDGQGTAQLDCTARYIIGTDKNPRNVEFARCLYPWVRFDVWDMMQSRSGAVDVVVCVEAIEHAAEPRRSLANLLNVAASEVWISTPNGIDTPETPDNPFHVREYTTAEMLEMLEGHTVRIRNWETWSEVGPETTVNPLVYQVTL